MICTLCPRKCGVDRERGAGFCGKGETAEVARIDGELFMRHRFEEPVISGKRGSGAIFFSGCNLRCVYCQNKAVSRGGGGTRLTVERLAALMLAAADGADTLSLVTAGHFARPVAEALRKAKPRLTIPVVYNSSGYELPETLRLFEGLIDVYLPDFKYLDSERAERYSGASDYPSAAAAAIGEMTRQTGEAAFRGGIMTRGVLIRHLVLPGGRREGMEIMRTVAARFPSAYVSVMRQYTPEFCPETSGELKRRVTSFEYDSVVFEAARLGLKGFMQQKGCAEASFTPNFDKAPR